MLATAQNTVVGADLSARDDALVPPVFRCGEFVLDVPAYELRRDGAVIALERRPMDLLILLVTRRGQLVSRGEIVDRLWGRNVFIEIDTSINTVVRKLRRALGDSADGSRYILTVQGKGYRCIADIEMIAPRPVVAVLPFSFLGHDRDHEHIADGLTEETIGALGQIDPDRIRVVARTSTIAYRDCRKTIREIGRELGADYVVEGSLRLANGSCRITYRLISAREQVQVRTASYDRQVDDQLLVQTDVGGLIAHEVHCSLSLPTCSGTDR